MAMIRIDESVDANNEGVSQVVKLISEYLQKYGVKKKELERTCLAVEEAAVSLVSHSDKDAKLRAKTRSFAGRVSVELSANGSEFSMNDTERAKDFFEAETSQDAQELLSELILKSTARDFRLKNAAGTNRISFTVYRSPKSHLYLTLGAMIVAAVLGFIFTAIGNDPLNSFLDKNIFIPVKTMYMNALKMIVAPVVFFSIVSCIVQFKDVRELGRIGGRIIIMYLITTLIATGIGIGAYMVFRPGDSSLAEMGRAKDAMDIANQTLNVSLKDTIVGFVPSNIVEAFRSSNMLQLIFLAIIMGIAAGKMGNYSDNIKNLFETLNEFFLKITYLIIQIMPVAVFCSIFSMMLNVGGQALISMLGMFGTFIAATFAMIAVYCLLLLLIGRVNPVCFLKKYVNSMVQVFSMASSNASIPINLKACEELGISKKVYSLSIPLGATINMDGECLYLAIFALALGKVYGVDLTGAALISMIVSIIILSMGAPGIPGVGLICLSVLLTQLNIPTEAIGIVMGIDALIGMFRCMSNCTGDVVASVIVARSEKLLDLNKYTG